MPEYKLSIVVEGHDKASAPIGGVNSVLGNMATIAGGIVGSAIFIKMAEGIMTSAKAAISAAADYQMMAVGIEALMAREIARAHNLEIQASQVKGSLTEVADGAWTISDAMPLATEAAKGLLTEIRNLAIQSPFELKTIQQTFKMGMAFGFTAEQSLSFTRGLLNTAAGVGATSDMLDRMAYNLAQVRMQGRVTAMDVRQLAQAGFDLNGVLVDMAAKYGYTITNHTEFNKLIDEGKLKWADFASSFEEYADKNFGGASKRLSQTWNGMMSNFKDVFQLSMPAILGPALEQVTTFLNGIMQKFIDFTNSGKLEEWGEKLGDAVDIFLEGVDRLFEAGEDVALFFDLLDRDFKISSALIAAFDIKLPPAWATFFNDAQTIFDGAKTALSDSIGGLTRDIGTFFELLNPERNFTLEEAFRAAFGVNIPPAVLTDLETIKGFFQDIKQGALDAKPSIDNMFANFATFWSENGAGIQESISNIVADLSTDRSEFLNAIATILGDLAANVMPFFAAQWEKISAWFVANGPLIQGFLDSMRPLIHAISETLMAVIGVLGEVITWIWNMLQPLISGIVDLFLNLVKLIMQIFTGDFKGAFDTLIQIIVGVGQTIWNVLVASWNTILGWFGTSFADLQGKWTTWWTGLKTKVAEIFNSIKTAISEKFNTIKTDLGTWLDGMKTKVVNFVPNLVSAGKDLMQGLWDGLKDKYQALMDWLEGAAEAIVRVAKNILGIASPSTVFADIGRNIMEGLGKGITGNVGTPVNAIAGASNDVTQAMTSGYGSGGSNSTSSNQTNFYVSGADDPDRVVDLIVQRLRLNGLLN